MHMYNQNSGGKGPDCLKLRLLEDCYFPPSEHNMDLSRCKTITPCEKKETLWYNMHECWFRFHTVPFTHTNNLTLITESLLAFDNLLKVIYTSSVSKVVYTYICIYVKLKFYLTILSYLQSFIHNGKVLEEYHWIKQSHYFACEG